MQKHGGAEDDSTLGVLRSDDGGQSWQSIAKGLPSDFGSGSVRSCSRVTSPSGSLVARAVRLMTGRSPIGLTGLVGSGSNPNRTVTRWKPLP